MREFRTYVVRTYSGALSRVTDHQVKMRPFKAQPTDTEVVVRSLVARRTGTRSSWTIGSRRPIPAGRSST